MTGTHLLSRKIDNILILLLNIEVTKKLGRKRDIFFFLNGWSPIHIDIQDDILGDFKNFSIPDYEERNA